MRLRGLDPRARAVFLMPLGALTVHQLRYELAFGGHAGHELEATGHHYLGRVLPLAVMLAAGGLGLFLGRVIRAWSRREAPAREVAGLGVWAAATLALVALYVSQESIEGVLSSGHPAGLAGILGGGGWTAIPLAALVGAAIALALRAADAAVTLILRGRIPHRRVRRQRARVARHPAPLVLWRLAPLAGASAGRAPPRARTDR